MKNLSGDECSHTDVSNEVFERVLRERDQAQAALNEKVGEWGEALGRLSAEELMHAKTRRDLEAARGALRDLLAECECPLLRSERDEARSALREYRSNMLLDSNIRYGPYMRRIDEEFNARFPWFWEENEA